MATDFLCFSHLRWDFVFQRPQHLLGRAARDRRVFFFEEPVHSDCAPHLVTRRTPEGVTVVQPHLHAGRDEAASQRALLDGLVAQEHLAAPTLWYYTPRALAFSAHLAARTVVYDCMDELSAFTGADPTLPAFERALMDRADLVFTGGRSLYEARRARHPAVHLFPSGVDVAHFRPARGPLPEIEAQRPIPRPRAGFFGVIDERMDLVLLAETARLRPGIQFIMVGPAVKIEAAALPRAANLHWLGGADYDELPALIAHWDVALMPFAINDATRYISPTKTPEYLAAGRPVVSTPIADVVRQYGTLPCVAIAADAGSFAAAIDRQLMLDPARWRPDADAMLDTMSWDRTWARMDALIHAASTQAAAE